MAKITYTNINGYLIPNLIYKSNEQMEQLGRYGILRKNYLKKHKNSLYQSMLLQGTLEKHLLETDKAAREREKLILKQLEKQYSLPDKESAESYRRRNHFERDDLHLKISLLSRTNKIWSIPNYRIKNTHRFCVK